MSFQPNNLNAMVLKGTQSINHKQQQWSGFILFFIYKLASSSKECYSLHISFPMPLQINITTHTHARLTALCPGLPRWAGTRKVKPIWILLKQETVSGSGINWAICKSAPRSRQITMPAPHHSVFLQAGCPSCRPTKSVKALKALSTEGKYI